MKQKEVSQLHYLNKEIKFWQEELEKLNSKSLVKGQILTCMPHTQETADKVSDEAIKHFEIEEKIKGLKEKALMQRLEIINYIHCMENSQDRQILWLRAENELSWTDIANKIGGGNTKDSVRKRYERLLKE